MFNKILIRERSGKGGKAENKPFRTAFFIKKLRKYSKPKLATEESFIQWPLLKPLKMPLQLL